MIIDIAVHAARKPSVRDAGPSAFRRSGVDLRWPVVAAALHHLWLRRRRSLRIVDVACGNGRLLIHAARHARALGFTAIEARGIDAAPSSIREAQAIAMRIRDPAIGLLFEPGDLLTALREESGFPADILLWSGDHGAAPDMAAAIAAAGTIVIGGSARRGGRRVAA